MTTPFPFVSGAVLQAAQLNAITTLPINDQTASYTLLVGDVGKRVIMNNASATTITVNNSVFSTGDTIFIANKGAGTSTITAGAGVTINSASGLALVTSQSGQLVALSASSFLFVASDVTVSSGVIQVVSTFKDDTFITTSNTFVDVTGMSVSITPTSASNKVFVLASLQFGGAGGTQRGLRLVRDSTAIALGASAGGRTQAWYGHGDEPVGGLDNVVVAFVDSPATTSATTYKIQFQTNDSNNVTLNRTGNLAYYNSASTITVMEVKP